MIKLKKNKVMKKWGKKIDSTQVNSTNLSIAIWDRDKKKDFQKKNLVKKIEVK
jgi:hypothetical protein